MQMTSSTATVVPSFTIISRIVPAYDEGTSAVTLSVITSHSGSYSSTLSPTETNHCYIVPSCTLSPSLGIFISIIVPP